jgi:hypothetical protein
MDSSYIFEESSNLLYFSETKNTKNFKHNTNVVIMVKEGS